MTRLGRAASRLCLGDAEESSDLAHETLIRTFSCIRMDETKDPWPLLMTILRNTFISRRRLASRERHLVLDKETCPDGLRHAAGCPEVWSAVFELEPAQKDLIVNVYVKGHSLSEAARDLAITEEAAKQRLKRARAKLRERLEDVL